MSSSASPIVSTTQTPTAVLANAAPEPKRKRAKPTKEQKKEISDASEAMWTAIRLKQEGARKDINSMAEEWNRYQYCMSLNVIVLTLANHQISGMDGRPTLCRG